MVNNTFEEIWGKLKSANRIIMSLHYGPDGDSLGSCSAMRLALEREAKEVILMSRDNLDSALMVHEFAEGIEFGKGLADFDYKDGDVVLLLDAGVQKQILPEVFDITKIDSIVIDHHATNPSYGKMNYVDSSKISTCSIILEMFKFLKIKIDSEIATRLLLGIYTDSGFFSHSESSLGEAAYLLGVGAEYVSKVVDPIKYGIDLKVKKMQALMIEKFKEKTIGDLSVGYSLVSIDDFERLGINHSDARGGINYLQELRGYDVIFTLVEMDGLVKGSFRTRKNIDVSKYAQAMDGGGHKKAAAFKLEGMSLSDAEDRVLRVIEEVGVHKIEESHKGR